MGISNGKVASDSRHPGQVRTPRVIYETYPRSVYKYLRMWISPAPPCPGGRSAHCVCVTNTGGDISLVLPGLLELLDVIFV